ncbi:ABC transporter permease [Candidatus Heimdallarchaeota archaeon]|nr:MAG: ABC transporter permease [Candidatus Heimdallarchaeota archaeon]
MTTTQKSLQLKEETIDEKSSEKKHQQQSSSFKDNNKNQSMLFKQSSLETSTKIKLLHTIKHSFITQMVIAKKEILHIIRYPWELVLWSFMPLMWLIPYVFQGQMLLGDALESNQFLQLTGNSNVLGFIFIGILLWNIVDTAIWGAGNSLRWEHYSGTLQFLWLAPISRINLMIGASIGNTLWSIIQIVLQFSILSIFVSWQITFLDAVITLAILIIVIIGLYGFSFTFAAAILVFKEPGVLTEFVDNSLYICCPVHYPMKILPSWIRWVGYLIPFTWGAIIIRGLMLTQESILTMWQTIGILLLLDVVLWTIGCLTFRFAEKRTLRTGKLGNY